jgi:hypothetical protein
MQKYRAYVISRDGRIDLRVDLLCSDDEAASERARQLVNGRDVELWHGVNLIETFKATH